MSELDINSHRMERRNFLQWSIGGLLFGVFAAFGNLIFRYLLPQPRVQKAKELTIPVGQIPPGSSLIVDYKGSPVILIHTDRGFAAFSAVCTHLGCIVKWMRSQEIFYCPCHAGKFDKNGNVLAGPPPEPLHKIKIEIIDQNIILL